MVNIRNVGTQPTTVGGLQQSQQVHNEPVVAPRAVDSTMRVSDVQRIVNSAAALEAPAVPSVAFNTETASGAYSFASQLAAIGASPAKTTDQLVAQFLKLQILSGSMLDRDRALIDFARSTLLSGALAAQDSDRLDKVDALYTQADNLEAQAGVSAAKAQQILDNAGVDRAELEALYNQSVADGGDGSDVAQRYKDSRPEGYDPERLANEMAAIENATPCVADALAAAETAGELATEAGAIASDFASGLGATTTIRAGTPGYETMLRVEADQQQIQNSIIALLSETRYDKKKRREVMVEVDKKRNEVAQLVLQLIDKHKLVGASTRKTVQP